MAITLAGAAELGMGDWDEVVNEIDRAHVGANDPLAESWRIQACGADIEVDPAVSGGIQAVQVPQERPSDLSTEPFGRPFEKVEQLERSGAAGRR